MEQPDNKVVYRVVKNHEEQYSILPEPYDLPWGWKDTGVRGSRPESLAFIEKTWTDMRPLSLKQPDHSPGGNKTPVEPALFIQQAFEAQVEQTPDAEALIFEKSRLTYRELNDRANQLARHLQNLGIKPEDIVGLYLERSIELIVAMLGILKAGAAYLPLDPGYPPERLAFILEDSQVRLVLAQPALLPKLPEYKGKVICLADDREIIAQNNCHNLAGSVQPHNLAYVMYTSGSTGVPKGVMVEHCNLFSLAEIARNNVHLNRTTRTLLFLSPSFNGSVSEIFSTLLAGGTLCLADRYSLLPGPGLIRLLKDLAITSIKLTPSALAVLPEADLPALKTILVVGEVCPAYLVKRWSPGRRFINGYGATEGSMDGTAMSCVEADRKPSLGLPSGATKIYLLSPDLQPVSSGEVGEIYLGGHGLTRGYLNRPALTAERFLPNLFSAELGARMYRMGDLGRYHPDGTIEFVGRTDNQVKIRGFRIELGEIESVLAEHPNIREAVAIAREDSPGDKRLVAYLVAQPAPPPSVNELRVFLAKKVPDYMIPALFVFLPALPLTPNGKVDRNALPAPDYRRMALSPNYVAPRSAIEQTLAQIWAQVLKIEQVGIHDNFFDLGGDSLLGMQVITRANQTGLRLIPQQLLQHQTIAELATVEGTILLEAEQGLVVGPVSLTVGQSWFLSRDFLDANRWNMVALSELQKPLTGRQVEQIVEHLLVQHDGLRARFIQDERGWQQVIAPPGLEVPVIHIELSEWRDVNPLVLIQAAADELQNSLNLSAGPMLRVAFFDRGADKPGYVLFILHHLVGDATSFAILLDEFQTAYNQLSQGGKIQPLTKTTSLRQWMERLCAYARSAELTQDLDYWLTRAQIPPLPVDYPEGLNHNTVGSNRTIKLTLSGQETDVLLQTIPKLYDSQITEVLLMALVQALTQWGKEPWVSINVIESGRDLIPGVTDLDLSRTVGWLTCGRILMLKQETADHPGEALKAIRDQLRRIPHQGFGYELLYYCSGDTEVVRKLKPYIRQDIKLNYLGRFTGPSKSETRLFQKVWAHTGETQNPQNKEFERLTCNALVVDNCFQVEWQYSSNLYKETTIERVANDFMETMRALIRYSLSQRTESAR